MIHVVLGLSRGGCVAVASPNARNGEKPRDIRASYVQQQNVPLCVCLGPPLKNHSIFACRVPAPSIRCGLNGGVSAPSVSPACRRGLRDRRQKLVCVANQEFTPC